MRRSLRTARRVLAGCWTGSPFRRGLRRPNNLAGGLSPDLAADRVFGAVSVGRGTYWGEDVSCLTFHGGEQIRIGRYCSIADRVVIAGGGDHRPELPSTWPFDNFLRGLPNPTRTYRQTPRRQDGTSIGADVWIGHGAHVGAGVEIGPGAIIGACAVVFSDIPAYAIVVGNPAKTMRYRFSPEIIEAMLRIAWWQWPPELIQDRLEWFYRPIDEFVQEFANG